MPSTYQILFPKPIANSFKGLLERGLLTPTFFSALLLGPVLPKQFQRLVTKEEQRIALTQARLKETLYLRFAKIGGHDRNAFDRIWNNIHLTHTVRLSSEAGIERVELVANTLSDHYVIHFGGNAADAMVLSSMANYAIKNKKYHRHNHVFWNYPGYEESGAFSLSVYEAIAEGVAQVDYLSAKGVPAQNITLMGRSIGGGFASQTASRLPNTNYRPNLDIDRSFASISAIPLVAVRQYLDAYPRLRPFYSAILAFSLLGLSTGFVVSGLIATIGLLCATLIATIGYILANIIQIVRNSLEPLLPSAWVQTVVEELDKLTILVDTKIAGFALVVHQHIFNVLGSIIGLVVAVPSLIAGSLIGVVIGGLLSLQLLVTDMPPVFFPLLYAFKLITFVAHIELDSVAAIHYIFTHTAHLPALISTNVEDDDIIPPGASLNKGLGFAPEPTDEHDYPTHCNFIWYTRGGHDDAMQDEYLGRQHVSLR